MAFPILGTPKPQFLDSTGAPASGGSISVLDPTTDAEKASYPTADDADAGTNANTNPITLNARGEPPGLWGLDDTAYKLIIADAKGATLYPIDDLRTSARHTQSFSQTASGDMSAALNAAFDAATGKVLVFTNPQTYSFTSKLTIHAGTTVFFNGTVLQTSGSDTSANSQIDVESNCRIDWLRTNTPTGETIRRVVNVTGDDVNIERVECLSVDQQNNRTSSQDAAFNVQGDRVTIGRLRTKKWDNGIMVENNTDFSCDHLECESYVRGFNADICDRIAVQSIKMYTASANATTLPGHNGVLLGDVRYSTFDNVTVLNPGEHGVRIGGSTTNPSHNISFGTVIVEKPGQCGFKINDGSGNRTLHINIGHLIVLDTSFGSTSTSNEDALHIEHADSINVGAMLAAPLDGSQAGFDGIYLHDVSNINIANPFIFDVANHGIHIHDLEGAFTFNKITISNPTIITCGANGIHIDVATASSTLRHILIK
ncbi:MAG TPA: right-handed parallel beta-helix repeat-containing protein, partial [Hyphomicrobiaceae bacterium]|nr:right-handed parallel beta-helix repeat-containing protein [Hyphomicrobiaceae bacterium]